MASSNDGEDITVVSDIAWTASNQRKRQRDSSTEEDQEVISIPVTRKRKMAPKVPRIPCNICVEDISLRSIIRLNCDCQLPICRACFNSWVENSSSLPECCNIKMEYNDYEHILSAANKRKVKLRNDELADANPIYCYTCQEYIRFKSIHEEYGTCGKCKTKTCRSCKKLKKDHIGIHSICPGDPDESDLDQLSTEQGWRKCPKCFARIEKTAGCDDIRCRCGCQFMYCCGQRENQCHCESNEY